MSNQQDNGNSKYDKTKKKSSASYGADAIQVLESIEAIRTRPGMYIGDTSSKGLHHLINEVVDNSVDEHVAGNCDNIIIRFEPDDSVTIIDDGIGIPVDMHKSGKLAIEVVFTKLHAGAKFGDENSPYKATGGLHGVGVTAVNAVSEWLNVKVYRDGVINEMEFSRGFVTVPLKKVGETDRTGTTVTFKPDPQIFSVLEFDFRIIANRSRELAFLNPGLKIVVIDDREDETKQVEFYTDEGLPEFVRFLNENKDGQIPENPVFISGTHQLVEDNPNILLILEAAFQIHNGYDENIYSYCNNIHTFDGGTHLTGFRTAITGTLNQYMKDNKILHPKDAVPEGQDYREGLTAVISIKHPSPSFESQTKVKLVNPEVAGIVQKVVNDGLKAFLEENPIIAKNIIKRASRAAEARKAARQARDRIKRKDIMNTVGMPGKLADCHSRDNEKTEVFLVEGDSAGGSAKLGRNSDFQAILPLRGKILNVEKATLTKMFQNQEIKNIVQALGVQISILHTDEDDNSEENSNSDDTDKRRRYGKVIIMTDADVDGSHIRTLLLTFFFRYMPKLVRDGRLYLAQPPLFKFTKKKTKQSQYINSTEERDRLLLNWGIDSAKLVIKDTGKIIEKAHLKDLLERVNQLEREERLLKKKHLSLQWFVSNRHPETKAYPNSVIIDDEKHIVFYSSEEFQRFQEEHPDAKIEDEFTSSFSNEKNRLLHINLEKIRRRASEVLAKIEILGFKQELIINGNNSKTKKTSPFEIISENRQIDIHSLWDVLREIRNIGAEGIEISRYKGLGEMNADELGETTMSPDTRTLLQVDIQDASEADRVFTVLMGSEVEPRRDYIEKNAAEVKNLDI